MVFTAPVSSGWAITLTPWISWTTNVTIRASRNSASCSVPARTWRRRISDSSAAVTNTSPPAAKTSAAGPILCPGISASSDTTSALVNAVSAPAARTRWICAPASASASRPAVTEMATNSSPIRAPATPPLARKKSWMLSGTTRRSSQPEISRSEPAKPYCQRGTADTRNEQAQDQPTRLRSAYDCGSEGLGFESLRARPGHRPLPASGRGLFVPVGAMLGATAAGSVPNSARLMDAATAGGALVDLLDGQGEAAAGGLLSSQRPVEIPIRRQASALCQQVNAYQLIAVP